MRPKNRKGKYQYCIVRSDVGIYVKLGGQVTKWGHNLPPPGLDGIDWSAETWVDSYFPGSHYAWVRMAGTFLKYESYLIAIVKPATVLCAMVVDCGVQ